MSDIDPAQAIHTRIWREEAEPSNRFRAETVYCRGYDVFGGLVGRARWVEMLMLLFRDELPERSQLDLLEALAVALANPGPRDPSIHAAMCGGAGGSTAAASLMAALAVGAGRSGGARDVFDAMLAWERCGSAFDAWNPDSRSSPDEEMDVWDRAARPAGFDADALQGRKPVRQLLDTLVRAGDAPRLNWLRKHQDVIEERMGLPLAVTGVAATALADLAFTPREGEMLYLLLRLPGAAAHALEQEREGYRRFPFPPVELEDDPRREKT